MIIGMLINKLPDRDAPPEETVMTVSQQLKHELDIDLPAFLAMNDEDAVRYLTVEKRYSIDQLRLFANLLYEMTLKEAEPELRAALRKKALKIYEHVHANNQGTLFLDVEYRLKELA